MDFFHSIPLSFRICPQFCSPLILRKACIKFTVLLAILSLIFSITMIIRATGFRMLVIKFLVSMFTPVVACALFIESFMKRNKLKEFELKITSIDSILKQELYIDMDYDMERKRMRWRFIRFVVVYSFTWFLVFYLLPPRQTSKLGYFIYFLNMMIGFGPTSIVLQLYFYRIVTFIDALRRRFSLINECINNFHNFAELDFLEKSVEIGDALNSDQLYKKLLNIRRACRALYSASELINDLFGWSLFFCIFQTFVYLSVLIYLLLCNERQQNITYVMWIYIIPHFNNTVSLATICEFAVQEVNSLTLKTNLFQFYVIFLCRLLWLVAIYTKSIQLHVKADSVVW